MLFIILSYILLIYEIIISYGNLEVSNYKSCVIKLMNACIYIMKWKQTINFKVNIKELENEDKLLFICNHQNMVDFINIQYLLNTYLPNHRQLIIINKKFNLIPVLRNYIKKFCIPVGDNIIKDEKLLKEKIENHKNEKTIMILFPEGRVFNKENIENSNKWCIKNNITHSYVKTLCPRSMGLYMILKYFKPNTILQGFISYSDDKNHKKAVSYIDFLTNNIPGKCNVTIKKTKKIEKYFKKSKTYEEFSDLLNEYWSKKVDNYINKQYDKYN